MMTVLDKEKLIKEGFKGYKLSKEQEVAIAEILTGYVGLMVSSRVTLDIPKLEIKAYVDNVRGAIINCLNLTRIANEARS